MEAAASDPIRLPHRLKAVLTQLIMETLYGIKLTTPEQVVNALRDETGIAPLQDLAVLGSFMTHDIKLAHSVDGVRSLNEKYDLRIEI